MKYIILYLLKYMQFTRDMVAFYGIIPSIALSTIVRVLVSVLRDINYGILYIWTHSSKQWHYFQLCCINQSFNGGNFHDTVVLHRSFKTANVKDFHFCFCVAWWKIRFQSFPTISARILTQLWEPAMLTHIYLPWANNITLWVEGL